MTELTGLQKVRKAVSDEAGWEWCDEHRKPKYAPIDSCGVLHADEWARRAEEFDEWMSGRGD